MILKMKIKPSLGNCVDDSAIYEDRKHRTEKVWVEEELNDYFFFGNMLSIGIYSMSNE